MDITPQLLMLYYALLYQDCLLSSIKTSGETDSNVKTLAVMDSR